MTSRSNAAAAPRLQQEEYPDGRSFNGATVREITQEWVDQHMNQRIQEFTSSKTISIFTGTWNVNAKKQEEGLHEWLLPSNADVSDIYAIGFQEIVDLNAMNVIADSSKTQQRSQFWQEKIMEVLGSTNTSYYLVGVKALVGLLLCVYAKESLNPFITDVRGSTLGVGVLGMMGNKGGVSVRLSVYDSSVAFVCAHLAAHRENVNGRNQDFKNIIEKLLFSTDEKTKKSNGEDVDYVRPKFGAERNLEKDMRILDHEIVFWFGDLNYRLDQSLALEDVFIKCANQEWGILRDNDQLNMERAKGRVFKEFTEGVLNFAPTYKYQPGTDEYDRRPEKKVRAPAWCDRVLWRTMNANNDVVKQLSYGRSNLMPSDHKPVFSQFESGVRVVISAKEEEVYRSITNQLEFWKDDSAIPVILLEGGDIDFGKVKYDTKATAMIKLTNTGRVIAHWRFMPKIEDKKICKRFLSVSQARGLLLPNESITITISMLIDAFTAHAYNAGRETMQDLVILRVEKSVDQYVRVTAEYERSCFGMSLEDLVNATVPIRNLPLLYGDGDSTPSAATTKLGVPKELWMLIDALWAGGNGLQEKDLFFSSADPIEVTLVRESLDIGTDIPTSVSRHAVAEALVGFLSSLAIPVIPFDAFPVSEVEEAQQRVWCRKFLETLPGLQYNVFVYFVSFLRDILTEKDTNGSSVDGLKSICMGCLTGARNDDVVTKDEAAKREARQQFMTNIIAFFLTAEEL